MHIEVLGSGEAYDRTRVNSSLLVTEERFQMLIGCGPTVPQALWRRETAIEDIDAILLSHCGPDHAAGLITLVNWMHARGRTKPLVLITPHGHRPLLQNLLNYAIWPEQRLCFLLRWKQSDKGLAVGPWNLSTAMTQHAAPNRALLLSGPNGALFFNGEGVLLEAPLRLAGEADLIFLECRSIKKDRHDFHGSWEAYHGLTFKAGSLICLYQVLEQEKARLGDLIYQREDVYLPEQGQCFRLVQGDWELL
ncbi:MBL fold metallo-hydrolase [Hahella sp. KA22]|uniref:MBL fold metallo-hydrolase n=1 Tax=Hahella sp. KA22 TaxID=1628392 RepID=UPI0013E36226|nr:MBL fold metallo-hydrolase [Hahella sp. KA22]